MDTIYEWLIKNTGNAHLLGNEGQYFTILNVKRETTHDGVAGLDIMVRNQNFHVLNLLVYPGTNIIPESNELQGRTVVNTIEFASETAVITYLSDGKTPDSSAQKGSVPYRVFILVPSQEAGEITFPPTATDAGSEA